MRYVRHTQLIGEVFKMLESGLVKTPYGDIFLKVSSVTLNIKEGAPEKPKQRGYVVHFRAKYLMGLLPPFSWKYRCTYLFGLLTPQNRENPDIILVPVSNIRVYEREDIKDLCCTWRLVFWAT